MRNASHIVDELHDAGRSGLALTAGLLPSTLGASDLTSLILGWSIIVGQLLCMRMAGPRRVGYGTHARLAGGAAASVAFLLFGGGWVGCACAGAGSVAVVLAAILLERYAQAHVSSVLLETLDGWHPYTLAQIAPRIAPGGSLAPPFEFVEHPRTVVVGELAGRPAAGVAGALHVPSPDVVVDLTELVWTSILFVATRGHANVSIVPEVRRGIVTWIAVELAGEAAGTPDFSLHPRRSGTRQWIDDIMLPIEQFESIRLTERFEFVVPRGTDGLELWQSMDPVAVDLLQGLPAVHVRKQGATLLVAMPGGATAPSDLGALVAITLEILAWLDAARPAGRPAGGHARLR